MTPLFSIKRFVSHCTVAKWIEFPSNVPDLGATAVTWGRKILEWRHLAKWSELSVQIAKLKQKVVYESKWRILSVWQGFHPTIYLIFLAPTGVVNDIWRVSQKI